MTRIPQSNAAWGGSREGSGGSVEPPKLERLMSKKLKNINKNDI